MLRCCQRAPPPPLNAPALPECQAACFVTTLRCMAKQGLGSPAYTTLHEMKVRGVDSAVSFSSCPPTCMPLRGPGA